MSLKVQPKPYQSPHQSNAAGGAKPQSQAGQLAYKLHFYKDLYKLFIQQAERASEKIAMPDNQPDIGDDKNLQSLDGLGKTKGLASGITALSGSDSFDKGSSLGQKNRSSNSLLPGKES